MDAKSGIRQVAYGKFGINVQACIFIAAGILLEILYITLTAKEFVGGIVGTLLLICMLYKPEISILAIIVMTASIVFEESMPLISIGIGSLHIADIVLMLLVMQIAAKSVVVPEWRLLRTALDVPLIMFYAMLVLAVYLSVKVYGTDISNVLRLFRSVSYYLLFFVITNFIREKKQLFFLVNGLYAIGLLVAFAMVAQAIAGDSIQLMPGRIENSGTFESSFETLRILPPGQMLLFALFLLGASSIMLGGTGPAVTAGRVLLQLMLGAGIILTYNRTYWVAIMAALCVLLLFLPARSVRKVLAMVLVIGVIVAVLGVAASGMRGKTGQTAQAVTERFTSIFAGKKLLSSSSIDDRSMESTYALKKIRNHLLVGSGLGSDYRPNLYGSKDELTNYVHNAYLWITLNTGIVGLAFFSWFYGAFLYRGLKAVRAVRERKLQGILLGCLLCGVGCLLMAFLNPVFLQWYSIVVLSVVIGIAEVVIRLDKRSVVTPLALP